MQENVEASFIHYFLYMIELSNITYIRHGLISEYNSNHVRTDVDINHGGTCV